MSTLIQDIRYAVRQLSRTPGFTLTVIITLALGIGANTAVFTLFDQVLLRTLPVERPKELVRFEWSGGFSGSMSSFGGDTDNYFSYPMYKDLRDQNQVLQGLIASDKCGVGLSWHNQAENARCEVVTGNYFELLGLRPALGRLLMQSDDTVKGSNPVLVLGYSYWKAHFGAARDIAGQTVLINGKPFSVLGVAPEHFDSAIGGYKPAVFLPMSMVETAMPWRAPLNDLNNHQSVWLTLVGRLKPGVSQSQAEASLEPLWHTLRANELTLYKTHTERFKQRFLDQTHLKVIDDARGFSPNRLDLQKPLFILMSMSGLLILLCAVNVATLLLLKAATRAREFSMRYALGAGRSRIVRQLLVEGGLLGIAGAGVGLACAPAVTAALMRLLSGSEPSDVPYSTSIDARILIFTLVVSVATTLLFSIAPVFHFIRPDLASTLRQTAGTSSRSSQRFRKAAVGIQIALSVLLLGCAGLFVRTLDALRLEQPGFNTSHLDVFSLDPSASGYAENVTSQVVTSALDAVRRIPGISDAAATTDPELSGDTNTSNFSVQGYKAAEEEQMNFEMPEITPGYFSVLRQPVLAGREFTAADAQGMPKVAVVNLAFAKRFFGSPQNAIGRALAYGAGDTIKYDITIAGVVGDTRHTDLRTPLGGAVYLPYLQMQHPTGVVVYARTAGAPALEQSAIRQALHQLDPTLVVDGLRTMDDQLDRSSSDERALAFLAVGFSLLAIILAAVGLYGVLAYSTQQRTREIGIRLALGARRGSVVLLVVREMALIALLATAAALPCTILLARLFRSQLYGVTNADPLALAGAVALTAIMVLLAAALPSRRAASVEPMRALRTE